MPTEQLTRWSLSWEASFYSWQVSHHRHCHDYIFISLIPQARSKPLEQMFKSLPRPSHPWRGRVQWERFQVGFGCKALRANPDWKVKVQHQSISSSEYGQKDQANVKVWFHRDDGLDEKDGSIAKEKLLDSSKWESQKLYTTKLDLDSLDWLSSLSITAFIKHKKFHGKMIL